MTQPAIYDSYCSTYTAGEALGVNEVVRLHTDGKVYQASASAERDVGVTERSAASGDPVPVRSLQAPSQRCVASIAIAVGGAVYKAADGKVAATGTVVIGTARTVATAPGDVILVVK